MGDYEADAPRASGSEQPNRGPDIERLLSLLEAADKGREELDVAICLVVFGYTEDIWYADKYTTSLDAAATLVPAGWFWRCGRTTSFAGWAFVNKEFDDDRTEFSFGKRDGTTPALALCIAALKARTSALRALAPPDARASGASAQESKDFPP